MLIFEAGFKLRHGNRISLGTAARIPLVTAQGPLTGVRATLGNVADFSRIEG